MVSLPFSPWLSIDDQSRVIDAVNPGHLGTNFPILSLQDLVAFDDSSTIGGVLCGLVVYGQVLRVQTAEWGVRASKQTAIAQLSSGERIQKASDDAARLSRGVQTSAKIRSQQQVKRNIQDGYSLLQSAQVALSDFREGMTRMRELSVQAANDATLTNKQRGLLQTEIEQVVGHLHTILKTNQINGQRLIGQDGAQFLDEILPNGQQVVRDASVNMLGVIPAGATG